MPLYFLHVNVCISFILHFKHLKIILDKRQFLLIYGIDRFNNNEREQIIIWEAGARTHKKNEPVFCHNYNYRYYVSTYLRVKIINV